MYVWQSKQRNFFKMAGKTKLEWHKQGNPLVLPGGFIFITKEEIRSQKNKIQRQATYQHNFNMNSSCSDSQSITMSPMHQWSIVYLL